jgi:hypothetical protein
MGQRWIIDVLADLKTFAERNDLPLLAAELEECAQVAVSELSLDQVMRPGGDAGHGTGYRIIS